MAKTIRGLSIEISGNTTKLQDALKKVNETSRGLNKELRDIDKGLKLDPKNTELLAQKQAVLTEAIENTSDKLKVLKKAQIEAYKSFENGELSANEYRKITREVLKTENQLKGLNDELKKMNSVDFTKLGNKMKDFGGKMSKYVTGPVIAGVTAAVKGTEELRGDLAKLYTNAEVAGVGLETTNKALKDLNAITGETDSNVEALSNLLQAGFKDDQIVQLVNELSGAVIKFPDTLKIEGLADGLQETLATGKAIGPFSELLERMGINLDDFNSELAEAQKNGDATNYVMKKLSSLGLAEVNTKFRETNKSMIEGKDATWNLQMTLSDLGAKAEPILTKITNGASKVLDWFLKLDGGTKAIILTIGGIAVAIGPIITVVGNLTVAFGALNSAMGVWGLLGIAITGVATAMGVMSIASNKSKQELMDLGDTFKSTKEVISEVDQKFSDIETSSKEKFASISKSFMQTLSELTDGVEKNELQGKWKNLLNQLTSTLDVHKQEIIDKYELIKNAIEETYEGDERINKIAEVNKLEEEELNNLQTIYDKHLKKIIEITGANGENIGSLSYEQTAQIRSYYKDMVDELGKYGSEIDMTNTATAFSEETQKIINAINEKLKSGQKLTKEEIEEYKKAMSAEIDTMIKDIDEKIKNQELLSKKGIISEEASKNTIAELEKIKTDTKEKLEKDIDYLVNEVPTLIDHSNGWLKFKDIKNPWEFVFGFSNERKEKASNEAKIALENFAGTLGKGVSDNKAKWENAGGELTKYFDSAVVSGMTQSGNNAYSGFANGSPDWKYANLGKSNAKAYKNAFNKEMDIKSPSKETEKSGKFALEGFLKSNNAKKYLEQGLKNAKAYTNAFQDNLNKYVTVNQNLKGMTPEPEKRFNFNVGTLINNTDKDVEALVNDMNFMIKRGDLK